MSPALPQREADKVDDEEVRDFTALDPGPYPARLMEVTVGEGKAGPYWQWVYEVPDGFEGFEHAKGRRFWNITSLSEKARFKLKETFDAFGVSADTNTDELCGKLVTIIATRYTQTQGKNEGKLVNGVDKVLPFEDGDPMAEAEDPF